MLVAQITAWIPDRGLVELLASAPLDRLPDVLDDGEHDFNGNASFSLGGAILLPFANRIRGRAGPDGILVAETGAGEVILPRNWGGRRPGAETYAMHGLILATPFEVEAQDCSSMAASLRAGDFGGHWLSTFEVRTGMTLSADEFRVVVEAANVGDRAAPVGIGWHPYLNLIGGERATARLTIPARRRLEVYDYDAVLPTGQTLALDGSPYDFSEGAALGDLYLDDCFVDLVRTHGELRLTLDSGGCRITMRTRSPSVTAVQVYAPPSRDIVVIEPQFNRPDPFSNNWCGTGGMVLLQPSQSARYEVGMRLDAFPDGGPVSTPV
jgi:aldose 1-epimerase